MKAYDRKHRGKSVLSLLLALLMALSVSGAAFDYAEEQSGSMLEYIRQRYDVTDEEIELLRELYLTD